MRITKEYRFCAAHRLMHHKGRCANIHGHNYVVRVTVDRFDTIDEETGMVADFSEVRDILSRIFDPYDHSIILNEKDPILEKVRELGDFRIHFFPGEPTAENMCRYFFYLVEKLLYEKDLSLRIISIQETEGSSAEFYG